MGTQEERKIRERNDLIASEQWDFRADCPLRLVGDVEYYWKTESRAILEGFSEQLKNSTIVFNNGLIAVRTAGVIWKKICDELEVLKLDMSEKKWGSKTARRKVLKKYRLSDHIFDHHLEEREALIFFLESHKLELEKYIRELANEFQIEIPLKRQQDFFNQFS